MPLPEVNVTVRDGALGLAPANTSQTQAFVGVSSAGTVNTVYEFGDIQTLKDTLGTGPLVELAALVLAAVGGPVICVRVDTTGGTAAANSAVTAGSANTGASVMTVTGTPLDSYQVRAQIVTGAANPAAGTAVFKYSLDGGRTYSGDLAMPTSGVYAIPNTGISLNWSAASLVANDTYAFTSTGAEALNARVQDALTALFGDPRTWFVVNVVGVPGTGATAALAGAIGTAMDTAASSYRYAYAQMQAEDAVDATLIAAVANVTHTRLSIAAGFANITSVISGASYRRPAAWAAAVAAGRSPPGDDLARVRAGPIGSVQALLRDEFKTQGLDAARFTTLRTHIDRQGYFLTNGRLMAPTASDFRYIQYRRVMDIASRIARFAGLNYLSESVRVNATTGLILEADARAIDTDIEEQVRAAVLQPGYVSDVTVRTDRTVNIISTGRLVLRVRIVPLGYNKSVEVDIGFTNPALTKV